MYLLMLSEEFPSVRRATLAHRGTGVSLGDLIGFAAVIALTIFFWRMFAREKRLLHQGTATLGVVAKTERSIRGQRWVRYSFTDSYGTAYGRASPKSKCRSVLGNFERSGTELLVGFIRPDRFLVPYVKERAAVLHVVLDRGTSRGRRDNFWLLVVHRCSPPLSMDSVALWQELLHARSFAASATNPLGLGNSW